MKEYSEQRRERLSDVIFDYISDGNTTPDELYRDIKSEIQDSLTYFQKYANKCQNLMDLVNGLPARSMIGEEEYHEALIHSNSPYNDGWTQQMYLKIVNDYEEKNVGVTSNSDWEDFWCNDEDPYEPSSYIKSSDC